MFKLREPSHTLVNPDITSDRIEMHKIIDEREHSSLLPTVADT
jgi:hypothetical protein